MNRPKVDQIKFNRGGEREFDKFPKEVRQRILDKVEFYISKGNVLDFAEPLVNFPPATHRLRIGKYRVCFYLEGPNMVVDSVDTRDDAYRKR